MEKIQTSLLMMFTLIATALSGVTHATVYNVTAVLDGSNTPGFSASSFHDASGPNVMAGPTLATITDPVLSGTYDDSDGHLMVTMTVSNAGPTVSIDGYLLFDVNGILSSDSTVAVDFDGASGALTDTTIGFLGGSVCCSGVNAPNSLVNGIMTLWGANYVVGGPSIVQTTGFNGYNGATLGMDLVLELTPVPVPAAVWLFGSGLLGLVGVARRRV